MGSVGEQATNDVLVICDAEGMSDLVGSGSDGTFTDHSAIVAFREGLLPSMAHRDDLRAQVRGEAVSDQYILHWWLS